jgi:hypothetical protein
MKTFNVYRHAALPPQAVKVGFSWPALIFGVLWAFSKRLWGVGWAILGISLVLSFLQTSLLVSAEPADPSMLQYWLLLGGSLAVWLVPAFKGNAWLEADLVKRGFSRVGTVQAETPEGAVAQSENQQQV